MFFFFPLFSAWQRYRPTKSAWPPSTRSREVTSKRWCFDVVMVTGFPPRTLVLSSCVPFLNQVIDGTGLPRATHVSHASPSGRMSTDCGGRTIETFSAQNRDQAKKNTSHHSQKCTSNVTYARQRKLPSCLCCERVLKLHENVTPWH